MSTALWSLPRIATNFAMSHYVLRCMIDAVLHETREAATGSPYIHASWWGVLHSGIPKHAFDAIRVCFKAHLFIKVYYIRICEQRDVGNPASQQVSDHLFNQCLAQPLQSGIFVILTVLPCYRANPTVVLSQFVSGLLSYYAHRLDMLRPTA